MIYVMSDVHGCEAQYRDVLNQIHLTSEDHLYILGDVIDRAPGGLHILRDTMKKPNITLLLGNHEHMMLQALTHPGTQEELSRWYWNGGELTHRPFMHCSKAYREEVLSYIRGLPLNIDITVNGVDYLLVHGAPVETYQPELSHYDDVVMHAVWTRLTADEPLPAGKTVIFGHTATRKYGVFPLWRIYHGNNRIGIDCGCVYGNRGRLGCLRLDDMQEFYSNIIE